MVSVKGTSSVVLPPPLPSASGPGSGPSAPRGPSESAMRTSLGSNSGYTAGTSGSATPSNAAVSGPAGATNSGLGIPFGTSRPSSVASIQNDRNASRGGSRLTLPAVPSAAGGSNRAGDTLRVDNSVNGSSKGSSFSDLYEDMKKEKVRSQPSTLISMKDELMAEKKERVRKEIKTLQLSNEEREYYVEAFCIFDLDGSGTIDVDELGEVMKSMGIEVSEKEIRAMMAQIDDDGSGEISVTEFVQLMATVRTRGGVIETEADIREAFQLVDADGDGFISPQDLAQAFLSVGEKITFEQAVDMVRVADSDLDGRADFSDFHKILKAKLT